MKHIAPSLIPILLLVLPSCREETPEPSPAAEDGYRTYTLTAATESTRSDLVDEAAVSSGQDIRLAVYTGGKRVADGPAPLELRLLDSRAYDFYAWTGGSLPLDQVPEDESELIDWEAVYPGWDTATDGTTALTGLLAESGMPMAGQWIGCSPGDVAVGHTITVPLERLFARIRLQISYDEPLTLLLPERIVEEVQAHNWAWACHPFGTAFDKTKVHTGSLDAASTADGDGTYTLYLPENLQGERLAGDPDRCSYLSVDLHFGDGLGLGGGVGDVCYRFYPGADGDDGFNIRRNRQYDVTLSLSYNGRFIEGSWKVSGDEAEQRSLAFDPDNCQPIAPPGGKAYLRLSYRHGDSEDAISDYFNRFNGVAVGLEAETTAWVAAGTQPSGSALETVGSVRCRTCGNRFWGYPGEASERLPWAVSLFEEESGDILCPVCRSVFYTKASASERRFFSGNPSSADLYRISPPEPHIAVSIPASAALGSVLQFHAVTRDGRKAAQTSVAVGNSAAPYYNQPLEGEQYVAERIRFTPVGLPSDITELRYRITEGEGRIALSRTADNGAEIAFLEAGTVDILVEDQNGTVRQRIQRTILNPGLRFLSTDYALEVDGSDLTPEWTYTRNDGSAYSDYAADLYESRLGDPQLTTDGVWTAVSDRAVYIRRTADGTLGDIPYLEASVGTLTATCPLLPTIRCEANLKAVNPFPGWPGTPMSYTVGYSWAEALKKVSSIPIKYNGSMILQNLIGTTLPLYAETVRGNAPFSFSEAEARAGVPVFPTVNKRPSVTRYYGQVVNRHSGTALKRYYATIAVNVEAYCTESHVQTASGKTHTYTITTTCRNTIGSVPSRNEHIQVFQENRSASIYPTSGRWGHGLTGCYWLRAYYTFGVQDASYQISMVMESQAESGTGDGTFEDFAGQNPVQFSMPHALDDGYTYLQIEGEPLSSPSDQGVWIIRFNPAWQLD